MGDTAEPELNPKLWLRLAVPATLTPIMNVQLLDMGYNIVDVDPGEDVAPGIRADRVVAPESRFVAMRAKTSRLNAWWELLLAVLALAMAGVFSWTADWSLAVLPLAGAVLFVMEAVRYRSLAKLYRLRVEAAQRAEGILDRAE